MFLPFTPKKWFFIGFFLVSFTGVAQTRLSGRVTDATTHEALAGVSLTVRGTVTGTITDTRGAFSLSTSTPPPFTLVVSSVGYESQAISVGAGRTDLNVQLRETTTLAGEVVVSASRVEESVLKSPVSIEKLDLRAVQQSASPDFYTGLGNLKGIDLATQSLTFKSINMRGFGATGNNRVTQLIDGIDNQAPGLNFAVDNIVGIPELDLESVEVLPGAASALYGPNALNGIILMNSKSPFLYQGLSAYVKGGVMNAANRDQQVTPFSDLGFRYAKAFNNKVAFKLNASYLQAKDWQATNYANLNSPNNYAQYDPARGLGTPTNYDGQNSYGDENQQNMQTVASAMIAAGVLPSAALGLIPNAAVSRTGFIERDLVNYNVKSLKLNGALHYRITEKLEAVAQVNYGYGTTVYTGTGRYALRNFSLTQAKLELRSNHFTFRAYTTQERSGQSYTAGLQAIVMNEAWKPSTTWFPQYVGAYAQAKQGGLSDAQAEVAARTFADQGRPVPGSEAYNQLRDQAATNTIASGTGSAFLDKSNLYHAEGVYNFKEKIKFAEVLIGANYRVYQLRSEKTLFDDNGGSINIPEAGGFAQIAKTIGPVRITASGRYDKNKNFEGRFTPRVAAVYTFAGENNLRLSYQTGFRIPTTQNQYIDLLTPNARLIGALPQFNEKYSLTSNPTYSLASFQAAGADVTATASDATFRNKAIADLTALATQQVTAQVQAAVAAGQIPNNPQAIQAAVQQGVTQAVQANGANYVSLAAINTVLAKGNLKPYDFGTLKTEKVGTWEIGYKGLLAKKLFIDAYYYMSRYTDFLGTQVLLQSKTPVASDAQRFINIASGSSGRNVYGLYANSTQPILTQGWALGVEYALTRGYTLGGNWSYNELVKFTPDAAVQYAQFNTPKNRFNLSVGRRITPATNWGFNVTFRHQDAFRWESSFVQTSETGLPLFTNTTVPANNIVDAQVSLKVPTFKTIVKLGASNLFSTPYIQAYGNPTIGGMYYLSLNFDQLLN